MKKSFAYIFQEPAVGRVRGYTGRASLTGRPEVSASTFPNNNCIRAGPGSGLVLFW